VFEAAFVFAVVVEFLPAIGLPLNVRAGHVDVDERQRGVGAVDQRVIVAAGQKRREAQLERAAQSSNLVKNDGQILAAPARPRFCAV